MQTRMRELEAKLSVVEAENEQLKRKNSELFINYVELRMKLVDIKDLLDKFFTAEEVK